MRQHGADTKRGSDPSPESQQSGVPVRCPTAPKHHSGVIRSPHAFPCVSPFSQAQEDLEPAWVTNNDPYLHTGPTRQFLIAANRMARLVNSEPFEQLVLVCIVMAGVLVGVQTYEWLTDDPVVVMLDAIVLWIFVVECAAKILACGLSPLQYFVGPSVHAAPPSRAPAPPHPHTPTPTLSLFTAASSSGPAEH
jgi:hypothetical protein